MSTRPIVVVASADEAAIAAHRLRDGVDPGDQVEVFRPECGAPVMTDGFAAFLRPAHR